MWIEILYIKCNYKIITLLLKLKVKTLNLVYFCLERTGAIQMMRGDASLEKSLYKKYLFAFGRKMQYKFKYMRTPNSSFIGKFSQSECLLLNLNKHWFKKMHL